MKNRIISLALALSYICNTQSLFSQGYENLTIKEEYDKFNPTIYTPCNVSPDADFGVYGDGMTYVLEGYITMYETTGDKAYLYKFIFESLCMMRNRHDYAEEELFPRWYDEVMYINGNIAAAFARFVHFVKSDPILYNTPLHPFDAIVNNDPFNVIFSTFGDYANWLQDRCGETLWWFSSNGYWLPDGFRDINASKVAHINMQTGFARAMLYIGLTASEPDFLLKASIIANQFKSHIYFNDICENMVFNAPVFQINSDNAYQWYHAGWRVTTTNCWKTWPPPFYFTNVPEYYEYTGYKEDISHAAPVTWLVNDFRKYQPNTPFNLTDMVRFKNMFAKRIYDGNGNFHNAVDGTDNPVFCNSCDENTPINHFKFLALNYIYLSQYDAIEPASTSVYDIVMNFYQGHLLEQPTRPVPYRGMANKGHAEVVQEQWRRECVSLTLFNRNVVYDQDFYVKRNLIIDPSGGPGTSFAAPITTQQVFTVEPGVSSNVTAGESVHFKSGTHLKAGSNVHVSISPVCDGEGSGMIIYTPDEGYVQGFADYKPIDENEAEREIIADPANEKKIPASAIYPNPFGNFFIVNSSMEDMLIIQAIDGTIVSSHSVSEGTTKISTLDLSEGVYIVLLKQQGQQFKIVKQ